LQSPASANPRNPLDSSAPVSLASKLRSTVVSKIMAGILPAVDVRDLQQNQLDFGNAI
jgi:hypothetical protein